MQAPVGPAATPELVAAVSRIGGLGTVAASWTEPMELRRQLREVRAAVGGRFCVNLVLAFDQRQRLEVVLDEGVEFVSFSWGLDAEAIGRARKAGVTVLVQVGDVPAALTAAQAGAEMVIAQGVEAGGHVQGVKPLEELLGEMRQVVELPILAAGGIADSASAQRALAAGADGIACGTAFLAAHEADVHPAYLNRLVDSDASDTVLTTVFDVGWRDAPHRVIRNETYISWETAGRPASGTRPGENDVIGTRDGADIVRYSDAQPTKRTAGDIEAMALYAGLSVRGVRERAPAAEIAQSIAYGLR